MPNVIKQNFFGIVEMITGYVWGMWQAADQSGAWCTELWVIYISGDNLDTRFVQFN